MCIRDSSKAGQRFLPVIEKISGQLDKAADCEAPCPEKEDGYQAQFFEETYGVSDKADDISEGISDKAGGVSGGTSNEENAADAEALSAPAYLEIAAALFSLAFSELEEKSYQRADFDDEVFSYSDMNMTRLFINAGRTDGLKESDIVKSIASKTSLTGRLIGTIELHTNFSFVDIPEEYVEEVISSMKGFRMKGRGVSFERASKKQRGGSFGRKKSGRRKEGVGREKPKKQAKLLETPEFFSGEEKSGSKDRDKGSRSRKNAEAYRKRKGGKFSSKSRRRK